MRISKPGLSNFFSKSLFLAAALLLAACATTDADAPPLPPTPDACPASVALVPPTQNFAGATIWRLPAAATGACVSPATDTHYVYFNRGLTPRGRLLLFLPGTGAQPRSYRLILGEAAAQGYHALGLAYPNETAIGNLCNASQPTSLTCAGDARRERLEGIDASPLVSVDRPNSIEGRLIRALKLMQQLAPADGWGQYVSGDTIHWRLLSVAGHSQGAGHAGYIGRTRRVLRVGMFGGPADFVTALGQYPTWLTTPSSATPAANFFGLAAPADELAAFATVQGAWSALGLGAAADTTNVDATPAPYASRRQLITRAAPRNPTLVTGPNHNVMVVDVNTPLTAPLIGAPVLAPVWRYMLLP